MGLWTRRGAQPLPLIADNQCRVTPSTCRWSCGNQCAHEAPNTTRNEYFADVAGRMLSRRRLLGLGASAASLAVLHATPAGKLGALANARAQSATGLTFASIPQSTADDIALPTGYTYDMLIRWGDPVVGAGAPFDSATQTAAEQDRRFGYNADYIGFIANGSDPSERGTLFVNHEYTNPEMMFPGYDANSPTAEQVAVEWAAHGASVVAISRDSVGRWGYDTAERSNRRITATTRTVLSGPAAGHALLRTAADPSGRFVVGMLNNCAGGTTPWGTFLTGEENFNQYFANNDDVADAATRAAHQRYGLPGGESDRKWERFDRRFDLSREPNEAYRFGWVVEIDPEQPNSLPKKRTALGRFKHEGAEVTIAPGGQAVVYMGDDERFDYVYKFVSKDRFRPGVAGANKDLLDEGTLYVAQFHDDGTGTWIPLVHGANGLPEANGFASQADILIKTRQAGDVVGATRMDRPEDVERNPVTGRVYGLFTNNTRRGTGNNPGTDAANPRVANRYGHIIEWLEAGNDPAATAFTWDIFMLCGDPSDSTTYFAGFDKSQVSSISSPDNCTFDGAGNLWIATDGQPGTLGVNDAIYAVATEGPERGKLLHFMSGVPGSEVCGPLFTPSNSTLFAAIQHPGDGGTFESPAGTPWPIGSPLPRPSVIAIRRVDGGPVGS